VVSSPREAGYRLLGRHFDYLLHFRPAEWPIMAAHTSVGYLLAVGLAGAASGVRLGPALLGLVLWVVCLNGGTLALNSAFDRDEGDVAYLRRPPTPPRHLAAFSIGVMGAGEILAFRLPAPFPMIYAVCFILSLAYSMPPLRLKAVAGADWIINMWGFGTLTPYAGWAATGLPIDTARGLVLLGFCPLFAALYPLTQLYQLEEDTRRGDRTLACVLGARRSLTASLGAAALAFLLLAAAGARAGWRTGGSDPWRWGGLAVALASWAAVLVPWRLGYARMTPDDHQRGMYRALGAWAVTDLVVVLAWGT
jgi:lycopene elongase/hydratase (dihydrobisanhydrobacterioruberin-forming)